jgi:hypothetical protein
LLRHRATAQVFALPWMHEGFAEMAARAVAVFRGATTLQI